MTTQYDASLITSEVCMNCGECCVLHMTGSADFHVKHAESRKFIKSVLIDHPAIDFLGWNVDKNNWAMNVKCSKLNTHEDNTVSCGIYEDRPQVCRTFNCLAEANKRGHPIGDARKVRTVVRLIHGKEIEVSD